MHESDFAGGRGTQLIGTVISRWLFVRTYWDLLEDFLLRGAHNTDPRIKLFKVVGITFVRLSDTAYVSLVYRRTDSSVHSADDGPEADIGIRVA